MNQLWQNTPLRYGKVAARRTLHLARDAAGEIRYGLKRLVKNVPAQLRYARKQPVLTTVEQRVVDDLNRDGIAVVSARELIDDRQQLEAVEQVVQDLSVSPAVREREEVYRRGEFVGRAWEKGFLVRLHADGATIPSDHPLIQLGVNHRLLNPINAYLGLESRLHYADAWYNIPGAAASARTYSQNWHRDPEDKRLVKVFFYTSDITAEAGPLEYIRGSRLSGGPYSHLWNRRTQLYPDLKELERRITSKDVATCLVPAGTMVFCDTSGFHRGGAATTKVRTLATWLYVSDATFGKRRFQVGPRLQPGSPSLAALHALG